MPPDYKNFPLPLRELRLLIRRGRLFEVQDWIQSGKPFRFPELTHPKSQILDLAVKTGFYSMLELLLKQGGWSRSQLKGALEEATRPLRRDMFDLLLLHGAKISDIGFYDVRQTMDVELMKQSLREGGDVYSGNALAYALSESNRARPLLDSI